MIIKPSHSAAQTAQIAAQQHHQKHEPLIGFDCGACSLFSSRQKWWKRSCDAIGAKKDLSDGIDN
jgi:hypothetical protein